MREKTIERDGRTLWMCSSMLAPVDMIEFQTTEAYSVLVLSNVKYSTYKQSREENVKVMERIRPNRFMHSENEKSTCLQWLIELYRS
jgi:hypothetical protein